MVDIREELHDIKTELVEQDKRILLTQQAVERISDSLYGDDAIIEWAKNHIAAERERAEIFLELKKKLAVRGTFGAISILFYLLYLGFSHWLKGG